jgi:hypothetical protein
MLQETAYAVTLTGLSIPGVGGSAPDGGGDGSGGGKRGGWSFRDV